MRSIAPNTVRWAAIFLAACGVPDPAPDVALSNRAQRIPLGENEYLLFRPQDRGDQLLGRPVVFDEGQPTIGDELMPECVVRTRRTSSRWRATYKERLSRAGGAKATIGPIAKIRADYGNHARIHMAIQNSARLDADFDGDCGAQFVSEVFVGTGARSVRNHRKLGGTAGGSVASVGVIGDVTDERDRSTSLSWKDPQAWMFKVRESPRASRIELDVTMPLELRDGEHYTMKVRATQDVWLFVYVREAGGLVEKLWPSQAHPELSLAAGNVHVLPQLRAALRDPAVAAQEWMVLCAFDHPQLAKRFAPPKGLPSAEQMQVWHSTLSTRLEEIGARHYGCEEIGYRIVPTTR
ncbi:MAG: hypothetical protein OXU20_30410 [Myxococcales bacterium]|nr:hypothetical protein [Myxococcales bacterium]